MPSSRKVLVSPREMFPREMETLEREESDIMVVHAISKGQVLHERGLSPAPALVSCLIFCLYSQSRTRGGGVSIVMKKRRSLRTANSIPADCILRIEVQRPPLGFVRAYRAHVIPRRGAVVSVRGGVEILAPEKETRQEI